MKKIELGQTVTILANLGVIAGIIFLGIELRQNNELMVADAEVNRLTIQTSNWELLARDPDVIELLVRDRNGEALTDEEELRLNSFWMKVLLQADWMYRALPDYEGWIPGTRRNFEAYGSIRRVWEGGGPGSRAAGNDWFDPEFVRFMEERVIGP